MKTFPVSQLRQHWLARHNTAPYMPARYKIVANSGELLVRQQESQVISYVMWYEFSCLKNENWFENSDTWISRQQ